MYSVDITVDNVIDSLANFLLPFCGGSQIVRSQVNRVPMPGVPCVILTEVLQTPLETSIINNDPSSDISKIKGPTRIDIQVDFYGPSAGDHSSAIKTVLKSGYAFGKFSDGIKPLYCSDAIQSPLVTGEHQWLSRWTITVSLQYNPEVSVTQDFADELYAQSEMADK